MAAMVQGLHTYTSYILGSSKKYFMSNLEHVLFEKHVFPLFVTENVFLTLIIEAMLPQSGFLF